MNRIALYTVFNDNFLECGLNMIYSFLQNNKWFDGDIIVLCDDTLSEYSKSECRKMYYKVSFVTPDIEVYSKIFDNAGGIALSRDLLNCYYKVEMLKNEYDRRVYLDSDVIVKGDISELFDCSKDGNMVVPDFNDDYGVYFNAGVMSLHSDSIPNELYNEAVDFCSNFNGYYFKNKRTHYGWLVDQDMFNELLPNLVLLDDMVYNTRAEVLDDNTIGKCKILHFWGRDDKPWLYNDRYENNSAAYLQYYRYDYMRRHKNI